MKNIFLINLMLIGAFLISGRMYGQAREEFNGPYSSWADVKGQFGAKGNGKDDDTKALQRAIDNLSTPPKGFNTGKDAYMVVYLPAGTYCISSTLVLKGKIAVSIIGEDPQRTIIKWTGKDSDTMFWANGSAYFKLSRLTWDANGRKDMEGVGIHWKDRWNDATSQSFATLNIEVSDNYFTGGFKTGIGGGTTRPAGTGANDSEITIRRCSFHNCTYGIDILGYNALDYWIWDCCFLQCSTGVHCAFGNYHIYRSYFSGSTLSDVHNNNGYYNSIRGCYSVNSNDFSSDEGASSNPFKRVFQDNIVIRPHIVPIRHNHMGKISLYGNSFGKSIDTTFKYSVYNRSWFNGIYEALSINNRYVYGDPIMLDRDPHKVYTYGDKIVADIQQDTLSFLRSMDHTPAKVTRKIIEVPIGADANAIQAILDQAVALNGQRPVVHFRVGTYLIDKTLEIPSRSDMQLAGDGWLYSTIIQQKDSITFRSRPLLQVGGPSYISIRDLQFGNVVYKHQQAGIVFGNVDQPRAEAHLDLVYSPAADTSLVVDRLNYLYVQKDNSFFTPGNFVYGGSMMQKNKGTSQVCCFGGQFVRLSVQQNGRFLAKDCFWEGADKLPLDLEGSGNITLDGVHIAPYKFDSVTTIRIGKFKGNISLMNIYFQGAISPLADNPGLNLLGWNIHFYFKMNPFDVLQEHPNYKAAFLGYSVQCFRKDDPACRLIAYLNDQVAGIDNVNAFLETMTRQTREAEPVPFKNLPKDVSNIYISRVSLGATQRGIVFNGMNK